MTEAVQKLLRERFQRLQGVVGAEVAFDVLAAPGRPAVLELRPAGDDQAARWHALRDPVRALLEAALRGAGLPGAVEVRVPGGRAAPLESEAADLAREARRLAEAAAARGRAFALGPLSVVERREIHRALGDVPGVWTQSEGDGIYRRLWVVPRRRAPGADEGVEGA